MKMHSYIWIYITYLHVYILNMNMLIFKMKQCKDKRLIIIWAGKETGWKKLEVKLPVLHFMVLSLESNVLHHVLIARINGRWWDSIYL